MRYGWFCRCMWGASSHGLIQFRNVGLNTLGPTFPERRLSGIFNAGFGGVLYFMRKIMARTRAFGIASLKTQICSLKRLGRILC